jgi:hypothetical protein
LVVLPIVVAWLIFINIPGERLFKGDRSPIIHKLYHGWPYHYLEREGGGSKYWSFEGTSTQFHIGALLLNAITAFCIVALAACATELWIRWYGSLLRFGVTSLLGITALVAIVMGLGTREARRCLHQQQVLRELAECGSLTTTRAQRKYDWFRSLFGADFHGTVTSVQLTATQPVRHLPDLGLLRDVESIVLEVPNVPGNVEQLAELPKLEYLRIWLISVDAKDLGGLTGLSEIPQLKELRLVGDDCDDASVLQISASAQIETFSINSSNVTSQSFKKVGELDSLRNLRFERAPLRASDFSALANLPNLKEVSFIGCNLSKTDETNLQRLWPDGRLHLATALYLNAKSVTLFRD